MRVISPLPRHPDGLRPRGSGLLHSVNRSLAVAARRSAAPSRSRPVGRPGYTLLVVLMVVVVLSLAAYRFTEAMTAQYQVAFRSTEAVQARAFAASGVHFAAGALADPDTLASTLGGNPADAPGMFAGVTVGPADGPRGGGRFSLIAPADPASAGGGVRYGVTDEAAKLNINALIQLDTTGKVLSDALLKLPNMTAEIADAIVDWVDADDDQRTNGAESGYYGGLPQPYAAKNGPLSSVDELLLVRGVTPQLLFGPDRNRNGVIDPGEDDGSGVTRGWADFLTVYGRELDADADGNPRIDLNGTDLAALNQQLAGAVGQDVADYVTLYRANTSTQSATGSVPSGSASAGANELRAAAQAALSGTSTRQKKLNSVLALVNTQMTLPKPAGAANDAPTPVAPSPLNDPNRLKELLPLLLDRTTTRTSYEITPRVNVNVAPAEVLAALPGLVQADVDAIVAARSGQPVGDPAALTGAWLVTTNTLTAAKFQALEKYVTGRSSTYRVHSVGYFGNGGPVARAEAVIDTTAGTPRIVYFRDVSDLGRPADLPR